MGFFRLTKAVSARCGFARRYHTEFMGYFSVFNNIEGDKILLHCTIAKNPVINLILDWLHMKEKCLFWMENVDLIWFLTPWLLNKSSDHYKSLPTRYYIDPSYFSFLGAAVCCTYKKSIPCSQPVLVISMATPHLTVFLETLFSPSPTYHLILVTRRQQASEKGIV